MLHSFSGGAELRLGGRGGFLLKIYLVKFWEFLAIHFSLFTVAPHKKFASALPAHSTTGIDV